MNRRIQARAGSASIPLVVLGGPTSANRAALLQRVLTRNDGRHVAVVHEASSGLVIDPALLERVDGGARLLRTGSICYGVEGDASDALAELRGAPLPVECVVLEAADGASLQRTAGYAYMPGFRPGGAVFATDTAAIVRELEHSPIDESALARDIARAELIVVEAGDGINVPMRRTVRRWLQEHAPRARVVECEGGCVPTALVLGIGPSRTPAHTRLAEWTPRFSLEVETRRHGAAPPRHDDDYRAWLLTIHGAVDAREFRDWATALPESIIRGDGELYLRGEPRQGFRFHQCGARWTLTPEEGSADREHGWIALVGLSPPTRPSPRGTPARSVAEFPDSPTR